MTQERQAELIHKACRAAGLDAHIRVINRKKDATTWAEKIAVQFMQAGQQLPVKNSYMFCDTLDMCFFYGPGDTPKVAYAGHAGADERDITDGKLSEAFRRAATVLQAMKRLATETGRYQVIVYDRDGGADEKLEYQDMEAAEQAARGYINGKSDGLCCEGAIVYDLKEQKVVLLFGYFPPGALPKEGTDHT